jgi:hypothetical protein
MRFKNNSYIFFIVFFITLPFVPCDLSVSVDNFWPWAQNKAESTTTYYGTQHFRSGSNIAAPRDGVPIDSNDAATDTINDDEASAIPNTPGTYGFTTIVCLFFMYCVGSLPFYFIRRFIVLFFAVPVSCCTNLF